MPAMPNEWYVARAKAHLGDRFERAETAAGRAVEPGVGPAAPAVEVPGTVSRGTNPGAWVMLWVWVPDPAGGGSGEAQEQQPAGD